MQVLDDAKAEFIAASSELKVIEDRQNFLKVVAPFNGIISKRLVDHGALIQSGLSNSNATALVELQQTDPIRLTIPFPETDVESIQQGMEAIITFPELSGKPYSANISRIARVLDFASKTMQVEIDIANPEGKIKPGMYAKVSMQMSSRNNVLSLPVTAQYYYKDVLFVLAVENERVVQIPLRKGLENKDFFEVLNPEIGPDTQVIIQGKGLVNPGQIVNPVLKDN
jgi:RND family efflux transporter MFP subunit